MNTGQEQSTASNYDPEVINQLKKEIMNDLTYQREWQEKYYQDGYGAGYGRYPRGRSYAGYGRGNFPPPPYRNRRRPAPDYDWWTDREEYEYQRNVALLRRQLLDQLRPLAKMQGRVQQVADPQVRRMLCDLLREAWEQGLDIPDLIQSINTNDPGYAGPLWDRIAGPLKNIDRRSFGWGIGAALLGLALLPSLGKSLRPLARKAVEEAMEIYDNTQGVFERAKEEFEDIVAEAGFNKMKNPPPDISGAEENNKNN